MAQKNQRGARRRSAEQRGPLEEKERDLRRRLYAEQADVDRLNRRSLAALFYAVTGQKAGKLAAEGARRWRPRCGAMRLCAGSRPRCGPAPHGRGAVRSFRLRAPLCGDARAEKAGDPHGGRRGCRRIDRLENELSACANVKREAEEAIEAGRRARGAAESVLGALDSAEGWGHVGSGRRRARGGLHQARPDRQARRGRLKCCRCRLRRFSAELSGRQGVRRYAGVRGRLHAADFFFDDFVSAWMVLDRVGRSKAQVEQVRQQIARKVGSASAARCWMKQSARPCACAGSWTAARMAIYGK